MMAKSRRRIARRNDGGAFGGDVVRVLDTTLLPDGENIASIGTAYDGALTTYHVTDAPEKAIRLLRKRTNVVAAYGAKGAHAELGPGFYVSGIPEFWIARATDKWSFLNRVTPAQRDRLAEALEGDVEQLRERGRVSKSEYEYARRILRGVQDGTYDTEILTTLASQPYSLQFWREAWLANVGIKASPPPRLLEVNIVGRFAELRHSRPSAALLRVLRRAGLQGAYTRASMGANGELVLWDAKAVRRVREVSW